MPLQTRRTHHKSRAGCSECKRRKIKCNEEKPVCSGCVKRSIPCEFLDPKAPIRAPELLRPSFAPSTMFTPNFPRAPSLEVLSLDGGSHSLTPEILAYETLSPPIITKSLGHFDAEDMALWHQFVTKTGATISSPWENELPLLAFSCDYLMHGILSTAALHRAYLNPEHRKKYENLSSQHQTLAIGPFGQAMSNITSQNCNEVFAFSSLLLIAQFTPSWSAAVIPLSADSALFKGPANWLVCLRGCQSIFQEALQYMKSGPLGKVFEQGSQMSALTTEITEIPQDEDEESLEHLSLHLLNLQYIKDSTTVAEMESYTEAISWLRKLLAVSSAASDPFSQKILAAIWPTQVSDTFVRMLHEERPPALIITAHYCLLLKRCHSCWYMEHRANYLFSAIDLILPEEWNLYVEHPRVVVQKA